MVLSLPFCHLGKTAQAPPFAQDDVDSWDLDVTAVQALSVVAGDTSQHYQPHMCHRDRKIAGTLKAHG